MTTKEKMVTYIDDNGHQALTSLYMFLENEITSNVYLTVMKLIAMFLLISIEIYFKLTLTIQLHIFSLVLLIAGNLAIVIYFLLRLSTLVSLRSIVTSYRTKSDLINIYSKRDVNLQAKRFIEMISLLAMNSNSTSYQVLTMTLQQDRQQLNSVVL